MVLFLSRLSFGPFTANKRNRPATLLPAASSRTTTTASTSGVTVSPAAERAVNAVKFVAQHVKNEDNFEEFSDDWKYVAMVIDRILLWVFGVACVLGK